MPEPGRLLSLVVPCFNEEAVLPEFHRRAAAMADALAEGERGWRTEFVYIDDSSSDETPGVLAMLAAADGRVRVLRFARNRGHQIAVTAGLDFARGDAVVIIDADLQDPPEVVPRMLELIDEGFEIIHAQRRQRDGETWFKLATARVFYSVLGRLAKADVVPNAGDFRAVSRRVAEAARAFREPHRFLRGMFGALGFRQCILQYDRDARFAGESKYPLKRMLKLAADALMGFSSAPVKAILAAALGIWSLGLIYLCFAVIQKVFFGIGEPGWTSLIVLLSAYTGLILLSVGVIGQYVGRIFEQGQGRPLYWLERAINIDENEDRLADVQEVRLSRRIIAMHPSAPPAHRTDDERDEAPLVETRTPVFVHPGVRKREAEGVNP